MAGQSAEIRIIKRKKSHESHHGGAWKVAYADFVTAMMAFFLVMWIVGLSQNLKDAIASYFQDPVAFKKMVESGNAPFSVSAMAGQAIKQPLNEPPTSERKNLENAKKAIEQAVMQMPEFKDLKKHVELTLANEGLKIDLLEARESLFFDSGSARIKPNTQHLLTLVGRELQKLPNRVIIEGHTDSRPLSRSHGYTNWELSADRANSARRVLKASGVSDKQIAQVRGYADTQPRDAKHPEHFTNRRVSIIVVMSDAMKREEFSILSDKDKLSAQRH